MVEFKTDGNSLRQKQDKYLDQGEIIGTKKIIEGIVKIAEVSTYKPKYNHLLSMIQRFGLLDINLRYTGMNPSLKKIYIIPYNKTNSPKIIDFSDILDWFDHKTNKDSFELALMKTLQLWYNKEVVQ